MAQPLKELPTIPAERALKAISGRWKASILYYLFASPRRLSELKRLAPAASQKMLAQQLRELEAHGLVTRTVFPRIPPHVEYAPTSLARSLEPIIQSLCEWGRRHAAELGESAESCDSPPQSAPRNPPTRRTPRTGA
jgi:DNA-binding HxlR family transcriptional regulator